MSLHKIYFMISFFFLLLQSIFKDIKAALWSHQAVKCFPSLFAEYNIQGCQHISTRFQTASRLYRHNRDVTIHVVLDVCVFDSQKWKTVLFFPDLPHSWQCLAAVNGCGMTQNILSLLGETTAWYQALKKGRGIIMPCSIPYLSWLLCLGMF